MKKIFILTIIGAFAYNNGECAAKFKEAGFKTVKRAGKAVVKLAEKGHHIDLATQAPRKVKKLLNNIENTDKSTIDQDTESTSGTKEKTTTTSVISHTLHMPIWQQQITQARANDFHNRNAMINIRNLQNNNNQNNIQNNDLPEVIVDEADTRIPNYRERAALYREFDI